MKKLVESCYQVLAEHESLIEMVVRFICQISPEAKIEDIDQTITLVDFDRVLILQETVQYIPHIVTKDRNNSESFSENIMKCLPEEMVERI